MIYPSKSVRFDPGKSIKYDKDPLLRLIRAARLVAVNRSANSVSKEHLAEAGALLRDAAQANAIARANAALISGRKFIPIGIVLPNHELSRKLAVTLPPPSDWLVSAVSRHKIWLHKIASKLEI